MKISFLFSAIILLSVNELKAQDDGDISNIFSVGVEAGVPVGDLSSAYSFAVGGSLQFEHVVSEDLGLTLNAGYINYLVKGSGNGSAFIPVLAGFKYYFSPKIYGSGQLGAAFSTESGGGTAFAYTPGIGYELSQFVDILARYSAISKNAYTIGNFGVRLAYNFHK